ncbi:MAG: hypothetical protein SFU86_01645 [Pirellulaceae bacterium]|nr:hypothetical protein [Pirellulaceae bacterium]
MHGGILRRLAAVGLAILLAGGVGSAWGQSPRPYDGIQAGLDAFQLAEERRQANVAQQLYLNDQMRYWSLLPTSGVTSYNGVPAIGDGFATPLLPPASLDFTYAYGRRYWTESRWRGGWGRLTVFEPWPFVPGDIYGYRQAPPPRQPVGQMQVQTGPNRWESHPVYNPPLADFRPLPPVASPLLDGTPYAAPRLRGPREY